MHKTSPYYPNKNLTYGALYFFIKQKVFSLNPFDDISIAEAKHLILKEAREVSPTYKMFITASTLATGLSERTIKKLLYETKAD